MKMTRAQKVERQKQLHAEMEKESPRHFRVLASLREMKKQPKSSALQVFLLSLADEDLESLVLDLLADQPQEGEIPRVCQNANETEEKEVRVSFEYNTQLTEASFYRFFV